MKKVDKLKSIKKANLLLELRNTLNEGEIDGKFSNKRAIVNALYSILKNENVEGRYNDEHWAGIGKLTSVLKKYGIDYELENAKYEHGDSNSTLPNSKVYIYNIGVVDKNGQQHIFPLRVNCAFVGSTGTMTDDTYELTYYFMV